MRRVSAPAFARFSFPLARSARYAVEHMQSNYLQIGSRLFNLDAILYCDLQHVREQSSGGGTCVRLWFAAPMGATPFLDLTGADSQAFRAYAQKLADTGQISILGRMAAATNPANSTTTPRRSHRAKSRSRAKTRAVGQTAEPNAEPVATKPVARARASQPKTRAAAGQSAA